MTSRARGPENRDIRVWAAAEGIDLGERGRIPEDLREQYRAREVPPGPGPGGDGGQVDGAAVAPAPGPAQGPSPTAGSTAGSTAAGGTAGEVTPVAPRKRKLWEARTSGPARRRESLENVIQFAWGGLANLAARGGRVPTARVLQLQAPVAGLIVDEIAKGTIVDRVLQPLARTGKRGEMAFALLAPPLLVEAISRRPDQQALLVPMLAAALEMYADIAGPKLAAARRRAEKRAQELGADDIQQMINWLFAAPDAPAGASDAAAA